MAKGLVASGISVGYLASPIMVALVGKSSISTARAAARLSLFGMFCFLVMAVLPLASVFVVGSMLAMMAFTAAIPLITQIYQDNYPDSDRGRIFSQTVMIRIATAAVFSEVAGRTLTGNIDQFQWLLVVFAAAFALATHCLARCPSKPLKESASNHPFRSLRFVKEDALFRRTLVCWMLMGMANLMMQPLRVEYLANPKYGFLMSAGEIAFLVGVIPNVARLVLSPIWGWLFDRMNFFTLRVVLNIGFIIGIISFFTGRSLEGLILGAIIFGVANAGGDVAWSLWVTKFSPPEHVADYMSVHTFFTGIRGVIASLLGFQLAAHFSMQTLGWLAGGMILISCLLLIPEIKFGRNARPGIVLTEEVSD